MTYRDKIKTYFETGDYPTQAQFWEFFDKIPFLDDGFASRITGAAGQAEIPVPAGSWVDKIVIKTNESITVGCGRAEGSEDVFSGEQITGTASFAADQSFLDGAGTLYFTGITPNTTIIIFTR